MSSSKILTTPQYGRRTITSNKMVTIASQHTVTNSTYSKLGRSLNDDCVLPGWARDIPEDKSDEISLT
jgi:hypothetical protein